MTRPPPPFASIPEAAAGRYPVELERSWQPPGTGPVRIRALRPDDLALERRFVENLSPQTRYLRLQYSAAHASERDLQRLLDLDWFDRLAVAGIATDDDGDAIVGVSRYAREAGTRRAECAVVVADGWQGRGLGTELMRTLVVAAQARGIDSLEGTTLAENQRLADWARRFGFSVRTEPNSGGLMAIRMDLTTLAPAGG